MDGQNYKDLDQGIKHQPIAKSDLWPVLDKYKVITQPHPLFTYWL